MHKFTILSFLAFLFAKKRGKGLASKHLGIIDPIFGYILL